MVLLPSCARAAENAALCAQSAALCAVNAVTVVILPLTAVNSPFTVNRSSSPSASPSPSAPPQPTERTVPMVTGQCGEGGERTKEKRRRAAHVPRLRKRSNELPYRRIMIRSSMDRK